MRIVAISNQKGGVGKTTTSVNLGAALAERGLEVLLIDLDPQGNASTHVGVDIHRIEKSIYDVLTNGTTLQQIITPTGVPGLSCAPSNIDLSGAEIEMVSAVGREIVLKEAIARLERDRKEAGLKAFDIVIIDCPPSLGLLSINALSAAHEILVPMQTEFFALQGMSKLMDVVGIVGHRINPGLRLTGIIACRMDTRTRLSSEVLGEIAGHFPQLLYKTRIRQNVKLAEAPSHGKTVIEYDPDSNGADDYRRLAAEFLGEVTREDIDVAATSEEARAEAAAEQANAG